MSSTYRIEERRANGVWFTEWEADTLQEALERIATERDENEGSFPYEDHTFHLFEVVKTEKEVPITIHRGRSSYSATSGDFTVSA
jgi:hypothetical protein